MIIVVIGHDDDDDNNNDYRLCVCVCLACLNIIAQKIPQFHGFLTNHYHFWWIQGVSNVLTSKIHAEITSFSKSLGSGKLASAPRRLTILHSRLM